MARTNGSTLKSSTPTGLYHQFLKAVRAAGATRFCAGCVALVLPTHEGCPDWASLGLARFVAAPVVLTLAGGLEAEPVAELAEVTSS
jgi:hypothetical protein